MISLEVNALKSDTREYIDALASRTKEALMARHALYAAASIHMTMVAILFTSLAVMIYVI
jgi:hypothetical protein